MYQLFYYLWNGVVWFLLELEQMSINLLYIRYGIDVSEKEESNNYLWDYFLWILLELDEITKSAGDALHIFYGFDLLIDDVIKDDVIKKDEKVVIVVKYEDKYLTKFNALTKRATTEPIETTTNVDKRFVMDMTPVGNVIMQYDVDKESFVYYSDNIIPFRYLETVSRKYVCVFDCKELFVERSEQKIQPISVVSIKTKDLMNQKRNPQLVKEKVQIEVKMNRYSNAGRLSNFKMLQPVPRHITDKKRLMRFSDFKNIQTLLKKV